jgi:ribonuclease BN (tRNA processing enzyme)
MRVTFLGTGSAMALPERHQTGLLVDPTATHPDARPFLVDCGAGVLHRLADTAVGYEGVSTVLLTHHHLDHVSDLLALLKARWLAGEDHLEVVGPLGTTALLDGLLEVHSYLDGRVDLRVREVTAESFELAGVPVEAYETRHSMRCLAYRFEGPSRAGEQKGGPTDQSGADAAESAVATDDGGSASGTADLVFSGDSEAFEGLASFADGAAVLIHDCSFPDDVDVSNHPTPSQLGAALSGHAYGRVYLTHQYPHTEGRHDEMLASLGDRYDGDVRVARDGLSLSIGDDTREPGVHE